MAELAIECPEGHADFQNTQLTHNDTQQNLRILEFLKNNNNTQPPRVESGSSSDENQRQQASQSPPPNCSICLGRVKSKCFTDSCMHQFCFSCLLEWSKVFFHFHT